MNLQQLQYIIAVDQHRHFVKAAESCFVTQATLSMMIRKLEDELGARLFDRSKMPVIPTDIGGQVIEQAKVVVQEAAKIQEQVQAQKGTLAGHLRLGIIPTLAPYLLPQILPPFLQQHPQVRLHITELNTSTIIEQLEAQKLDAAILATPLERPSLLETPLFYEQFVVYAAQQHQFTNKKYILPADIDVNELWLLEEGHCLRTQALNLCELKKQEAALHQLNYQAGSIETLRKLVRLNNGVTIIPELALADLTEDEKACIRFFKPPAPVREISMVTYRHFIKQRLVQALQQVILQQIPPAMHSPAQKSITSLATT